MDTQTHLCTEHLVSAALRLTHPSVGYDLAGIVGDLERRYGMVNYEATWRRITGGVVPDFFTAQKVLQVLQRRLVDAGYQGQPAQPANIFHGAGAVS